MSSELPLRFIDVKVDATAQFSYSFDVPPHRCVAVAGDGKSGVDKLGEIALGLTRPVDGTALIYNEDLSMMNDSAALAFRRRVGYLPANDGLMQNLPLGSNIALPLRFGSAYTESEINGRVGVIMAALRVGDYAGKRPPQVSEEIRRRAAVARALAFDPKLVILEQPFDGITTRCALELLQIVRGGEVSDGSRRSVLILGQYLPDQVTTLVDLKYRATKGEFKVEP